jgi:hypothetical protein
VLQYSAYRNAVGHEGDDAHVGRAYWAHEPSPDSDQPFARLLAKIIDITGLDIRIGDTDLQEILAKF